MSTPNPIATVGTLTLTWQAPTANKDGTSPVTPLSGYTVLQGFSAAIPPVMPATLTPVPTTLTNGTTVPPTQLTWTSAQLPPGTYYYAVVADAVDTAVSADSNIVSSRLNAPVEIPGQPTNVTITATVSASV
jgi:hypothetical protein